MGLKNRQFWVTAYKADNALYSMGQAMKINCKHTVLGNFGMTTTGQEVPLPGATFTPGPSKSTLIVPSAQIPAGETFPSANEFAGAQLRTVTKIKDEIALVTFYVNPDEYLANVITCNPTTHN